MQESLSLEEIIKKAKANIGDTKHYACEICKDKEIIEWEEDGYIYSKDCECLVKKRNLEKTKKHIEQSGLVNVLNTLTFNSYKADTTTRKTLKERATKYLKSDSWWFISGYAGVGKTHITTAICGELINQGKSVYYMNWKDESIELKMSMTEEEYGKKIKFLTEVDVLYIDDLLKGRIKETDIDLLYMIINGRYSKDKKTLISTEKSLKELREIDEAIAGRLYQKTDKEYWLQIQNTESYRFQSH